MPRVAVIGSGGAGKSTFAAQLGRRLGIPVIHLDRIYWKPGWTPTPAADWRAAQAAALARADWIVDGNYGGTLDLRLRAVDVVVFFDVPRRTAIAGALRRWIRHRGTAVQAPGCPERLDLIFLRWIWRYPRDSRPRVLAALRDHASAAEVIVVRSRRDAAAALERLAPGDPPGAASEVGESTLR